MASFRGLGRIDHLSTDQFVQFVSVTLNAFAPAFREVVIDVSFPISNHRSIANC